MHPPHHQSAKSAPSSITTIRKQPQVPEAFEDCDKPPPTMNPAPSKCARSNQRPTAKKPPKTPKTYLERIPVAGMTNLLYSKGNERRFWSVLMILALATTLFYSIPTVVKFVQFTTVFEVRRLTEPTLQFPNIYACVTDAINGTFFYEMIATYTPDLIKDRRMQRLAKGLGTFLNFRACGASRQNDKRPNTEEFRYNRLPPNNDLTWMSREAATAYNELLYKTIELAGTRWMGVAYFYTEGMYKCGEVFKMCRLNQREFPCCPSDGFMYSASVSSCSKWNISEIFPDGDYFTSSGRAELTFESTIDGRYTIEQNIEVPQVGLMFGGHLSTLFDSLLTVSPDTQTFVNIKSRRRRLNRACIHRYQFDENRHKIVHRELEEYFRNMTDPNKYSVEKCTFAQMIEALSTICGCVIYYDTLHPNETSICTPAHLHVCYGGAFQSDVQVQVKGKAGEPNGGASNGGGGTKSEDMFVYLKKRAAECMPLCDSWEYTGHITFAPLAEEEIKPTAGSTIARNKVTIIVEPEYSYENDVLKYDVLEFLNDIGVGLGWILGMSAVTFIQGAIWASAACYLHRKRKMVGP